MRLEELAFLNWACGLTSKAHKLGCLCLMIRLGFLSDHLSACHVQGRHSMVLTNSRLSPEPPPPSKSGHAALAPCTTHFSLPDISALLIFKGTPATPSSTQSGP